MRGHDRSDLLLPQTVFAILATAFGITLALLTAPFQAPDEPAHLLRIWQVSEGQLVSVRYGGDVPASLGECFNRFGRLPLHPQRKTSPGEIWQEFHRPLAPARRQFLVFASTAIYSPVAYVPQAVAVGLGRLCSVPPIGLMYAGRCANALAYAALGWLAVRTLPVLHWPACLTLLAPLPLFLAGSLSADPITTGLAFVASACVLRVIASPPPPPRRLLAVLALSMIGTVLCKWTYFPVLVLLATVPARAWGRGRWAVPVGIAAAAAVAFGVWSGLSAPTHVPLRNADPMPQLRWLLSHPWQYALVVARTIRVEHTTWVWTSIGVLGWLDTKLSPYFVGAYVLLTAWLVLNDAGVIILPRATRLAAAVATLVAATCILTCVYLVWDPVGSPRIAGVQGRYFVPLALLAFVAVRRAGTARVPPRWVQAVLLCSCLYTVAATLFRYY